MHLPSIEFFHWLLDDCLKFHNMVELTHRDVFDTEHSVLSIVLSTVVFSRASRTLQGVT